MLNTGFYGNVYTQTRSQSSLDIHRRDDDVLFYLFKPTLNNKHFLASKQFLKKKLFRHSNSRSYQDCSMVINFDSYSVPRVF